MKRNLVPHHDEILQQKCDPVDFNNTEVMQDLMDSFKVGTMLGLSAPQIGIKLQCSLCLFSTGLEVVANPQIELLGKEIPSMERCLSFPNILCKVMRSDKVKLTYFDSQWNKKEVILTGLDALVAQHEYDHLQGETMIKKAVSKQFKRA